MLIRMLIPYGLIQEIGIATRKRLSWYCDQQKSQKPLTLWFQRFKDVSLIECLIITCSWLFLLLLSSSGLSSFVFGSLGGRFGLSTLVEIEWTMLVTDWDQQLSRVEILDQSTSNGTTDLELFAKNGSCNTEDLRNFLFHFLHISGLEEDSIVKLFLDLDFSPTLLLGFYFSGFLFSQLCTFGLALRCVLRAYLCFFSL